MYSYGGSLYKKNSSLKSQLNCKPQQKLPLTEEYTFSGYNSYKKIVDNSNEGKIYDEQTNL